MEGGLPTDFALEAEANREDRCLIAALTERILELEAPPQSAQEAEGIAESASEGESGEEAPEERPEAQDAGEQPRPWWRRIFGG